MNVLVTICARGGSKGVKGKNIKKLAGKPLIGYSIEHAKKWGRADHIIVSTESSKIQEIANSFGAETIFTRPDKLASDEAGKIPVIRHAHAQAEKHYSKTFDALVDLDVSAPIRSIAEIEACYQKFLQERPLNLISVVPSHKSPYFNMLEISDAGNAYLSKSECNHVRRRQDAPVTYDINGSIYIYSREFLTGNYGDNVVSENSIVFEMNPIASWDIDTEFDFKYVEFLIEKGYYPYN